MQNYIIAKSFNCYAVGSRSGLATMARSCAVWPNPHSTEPYESVTQWLNVWLATLFSNVINFIPQIFDQLQVRSYILPNMENYMHA